eukprot:CFRG3835T1
MSCATCKESVDGHATILSAGKVWHTKCLDCSSCHAKLRTDYFEKGGEIFCTACYRRIFLTTCMSCGEAITDKNILPGTHYAFRNGKLYCREHCFVKRVSRRLRESSDSRTSLKEPSRKRAHHTPEDIASINTSESAERLGIHIPILEKAQHGAPLPQLHPLSQPVTELAHLSSCSPPRIPQMVNARQVISNDATIMDSALNWSFGGTNHSWFLSEDASNMDVSSKNDGNVCVRANNSNSYSNDEQSKQNEQRNSLRKSLGLSIVDVPTVDIKISSSLSDFLSDDCALNSRLTSTSLKHFYGLSTDSCTKNTSPMDDVANDTTFTEMCGALSKR